MFLPQSKLNWLERNIQWSQVFTGKMFLLAYLKRTEKRKTVQVARPCTIKSNFKGSAPGSRGAQNELIWILVLAGSFYPISNGGVRPVDISTIHLDTLWITEGFLEFSFKKSFWELKEHYSWRSFSSCWERTSLIPVDNWGWIPFRFKCVSQYNP